MVGVPIDLLWLPSLGLGMGEEKSLEIIKMKKNCKSHKQKETERKYRHPNHPWFNYLPFYCKKISLIIIKFINCLNELILISIH